MTDEMIPLWSEGKDSFLNDPPNATLSVFTTGGKLATVKMPHDVDAASLFIDVIGMPLTPVSYAGAAGRTTRRAIVY